RGRDHSPRYSLSVKKATVRRLGFKSVADGVSEIENLAQAMFPLVGGDYVRFQTHRVGDDSLQQLRITRENLAAIVFEQTEQLGVADDSRLQRFIKACIVLTLRQGGENRGIDEHGLGLVECADKILASAKIDASLTADRRVDLGKDRRGNLDEIHTAHVEGREQAGNVPDDASTEGEDRGFSIGAKFHELLG